MAGPRPRAMQSWERDPDTEIEGDRAGRSWLGAAVDATCVLLACARDIGTKMSARERAAGPDFRYASKALAASADANSMETTSRHGRPVQVWRESPRLCAARRAHTLAVSPVYQRSGWDALRRT